MFGFPAVFANGYMFSGLHQDNWVVRLTDTDLSELAAQGGVPFEPMPGRPMRGYLALPAAVAGDPAAARPWVERALANVLAMPAKAGR
jgi:TfoX/Sxy family transcriptional regulator of competence genes